MTSLTSPVFRIYGIKNCDTMKKAMRWLDEQAIPYEFIDYKKTSIAASHLPDWAAKADWKLLLNTRGLTWKKLSEEERSDVDESKALELMSQYPSLIKRPVLDTGHSLLVGFDPEKYAQEAK